MTEENRNEGITARIFGIIMNTIGMIIVIEVIIFILLATYLFIFTGAVTTK
jgi:hypothetical protein